MNSYLISKRSDTINSGRKRKHSVRKTAGKQCPQGISRFYNKEEREKRLRVGFADDTSGEFQNVQWNIRERSEEWKGWTWSWRIIWYLD